MVLSIFLLGALALALWLASAPARARRRRARLSAQPLPAAWRAIVEARVPAAARLPAALRRRHEAHLQVFLAEKRFVGCDGLVVSDEMRVVVAAQACLLLAGRAGEVFPGVREILLYPGAFVVSRTRPGAGGVVHEERRVLAGEAWSHGQIVLSWADALAGAAQPDDGHNLVVHEFAHALDHEAGAANGAPVLGPRIDPRRWAQVMGEAYAALQWRAGTGEPTLLDPYGAADPAEFFAVASEVFFEQPARLAAEHPALYGALADYYALDPARWQP
jgi:Mlc titration factor MtfA (ptsG expression regulator)